MVETVNPLFAGRLCVHHPQRAGHATCMNCRHIVCQECATTWDGINFCRPCLALKQATVASTGVWSERGRVIFQLVVCVLVLAATARIAAWSLAIIRSWST